MGIKIKDTQNRDNFKELLSVLSKDGAIEILNETESKLKSKRETHKKLGLTKRQYYTRLRELKNFDVVKKEGERYIQTEKGKKLNKIIEFLNTVAGEKSRNGDIDTEKDVLPDFNETGEQTPKIVTDYEALVEEILRIMEEASKELVLASKYIDWRIVKKCLKLAEKKQINQRLISKKFNPTESGELMKAISSPNDFKLSFNFAKDSIRVVPDLSYSFIVGDKENIGLEIVNPLSPTSFQMAVFLKNEKIGKKMQNYFDYMFEEAEVTPVDERIKKKWIK